MRCYYCPVRIFYKIFYRKFDPEIAKITKKRQHRQTYAGRKSLAYFLVYFHLFPALKLLGKSFNNASTLERIQKVLFRNVHEGKSSKHKARYQIANNKGQPRDKKLGCWYKTCWMKQTLNGETDHLRNA